MQNRSAFHFIAIDQIRESTANPRQTFEQNKLEELAESSGSTASFSPSAFGREQFEIVGGARRYRARSSRSCFPFPAVSSRLMMRRRSNGS